MYVNPAIPDAPLDNLPVITRPEATDQLHSQGAEIVPQYRHNRGNLTDLLPRRRRRPNFHSLWLPYCFLLFMFSFGPCTYTVLVRDKIFLTEQPGIAMSESSWKIVTEWAPEEEIQTISVVKLLIQQLSDISARHRRNAKIFHEKDVSSAFRDSPSFMVAGKIETKVLFLFHTN